MKNINLKLLIVLIGALYLTFIAIPVRADLVSPEDRERFDLEKTIYKDGVYINKLVKTCKPGETVVVCTQYYSSSMDNSAYDRCMKKVSSDRYYFWKKERSSTKGKEYFCKKPRNKTMTQPFIWVFMVSLSFCLLYLLRINRRQKT